MRIPKIVLGMFTSTSKIIKSYFDLSMITSNELILTAKLQLKKNLASQIQLHFTGARHERRGSHQNVLRFYLGVISGISSFKALLRESLHYLMFVVSTYDEHHLRSEDTSQIQMNNCQLNLTQLIGVFLLAQQNFRNTCGVFRFQSFAVTYL